MRDEMPRREWIAIQIRAGRRVTRIDPAFRAVHEQARHFSQIAA